MMARGGPGARTAAKKPGKGGKDFSLIPNEKLIEIHAAMVKLRMIAVAAGKMRRRGALRMTAGREAALAGVCIDLAADDALSVAAEDAAAWAMKGMTLSELPGYLEAKRQRAGGQAKAHVNNGMIPFARTAATRLAVACGVAQTQKWRGTGAITLAVSGDGMLQPDEWHEPLCFAGQHGLPIVFVCHSEPGGERAFEQIAAHAQVCGIPAITVDGWDAVAVYRVASESIGRARKGRGATLIECRSDKQTAEPQRRARTLMNDPLLKMEAYLKGKGLWNQRLRTQVALAFDRELAAAMKKRKK